MPEPQANDDWPFPDTRSFAVVTVRQVIREGAPIVYISHDEEGDWQFLGPDPPDTADIMLVELAYMLKLDPSVGELGDLPRGWCAYRKGPNEPWKAVPQEAPIDENDECLMTNG